MTVCRYELRVDVSDVVPAPEAELAATLVVPENAEEGPRTLAVGFPGAFIAAATGMSTTPVAIARRLTTPNVAGFSSRSITSGSVTAASRIRLR